MYFSAWMMRGSFSPRDFGGLTSSSTGADLAPLDFVTFESGLFVLTLEVSSSSVSLALTFFVEVTVLALSGEAFALVLLLSAGLALAVFESEESFAVSEVLVVSAVGFVSDESESTALACSVFVLDGFVAGVSGFAAGGLLFPVIAGPPGPVAAPFPERI